MRSSCVQSLPIGPTADGGSCAITTKWLASVLFAMICACSLLTADGKVPVVASACATQSTNSPASYYTAAPRGADRNAQGVAAVATECLWSRNRWVTPSKTKKPIVISSRPFVAESPVSTSSNTCITANSNSIAMPLIFSAQKSHPPCGRGGPECVPTCSTTHRVTHV